MSLIENLLLKLHLIEEKIAEKTDSKILYIKKELLLHNDLEILSILVTDNFSMKIVIRPGKGKFNIIDLERRVEEEVLREVILSNIKDEYLITVNYIKDSHLSSKLIDEIFYKFNPFYKKMDELISQLKADGHKIVIENSMSLEDYLINLLEINDALKHESMEEVKKVISDSLRSNINKAIIYTTIDDNIRIGIKGSNVRFTINSLRIEFNLGLLLQTITSKNELERLITILDVCSSKLHNKNIKIEKELEVFSNETDVAEIIATESILESFKKEKYSIFQRYINKLVPNFIHVE